MNTGNEHKNEIFSYFLLSRKIFESAIWKDNPAVLKLFIYLIGKARHSQKPNRFPGFEVKRGELVTSLRIIAEDNEYIEQGSYKKWSPASVSRMLIKLEKNDYIMILADTYGTHLRICNYDIYQTPSHYHANTTETDANTTETVVKTYNNDNNDNNEKNIYSDFENFWNQYHSVTRKPKTDKEPAKKHWKQMSTVEREKAIQNIQLYFNSLKDKKFCKKARTYLCDKNYNDEFKQSEFMDDLTRGIVE